MQKVRERACNLQMVGSVFESLQLREKIVRGHTAAGLEVDLDVLKLAVEATIPSPHTLPVNRRASTQQRTRNAYDGDQQQAYWQGLVALQEQRPGFVRLTCILGNRLVLRKYRQRSPRKPK